MSSIPDDLNIDAVIAGESRLSDEQAVWCLRHADLHDLGAWADAVARRIHGSVERTYVIDRNINYTNVCSANCTFCAFKRDLGDDEAYVLSRDELHAKISELAEIGGTQVLMQGGMHPELPLSFYEKMLRNLTQTFPQIHLHAFSPPEIVEFVAILELDGFATTEPGCSQELGADVWAAKLEAIMKRLIDAGLASVPGGGGEILPEHVRWRIGPGKATGQQWLDVMRAAHRLGMNTSATMMFGHIEGLADRVMHMRMIRDAQDEAIASNWPGRYMAFISWPFQPDNTPLGRVREFDPSSGEPFPGDVLGDAVFAGHLDGMDRAACREVAPEAGRQIRRAGSVEYLRTQAVSRLYFDNIHSIGSSWVTMGPKIGQLALFFGANDMGSVMMEENVVSAAGTTYCLNEATICRLIRDAGFTPAQRDNAYQTLKTHGEDGPDLRVDDWSVLRPADMAPASDEPVVELTVRVGDNPAASPSG
jgi:cyclic dehypoxanthinyl futalosine synthase